MDYLLHVVILIGFYTILAASLDLIAGHTGILSVAHAAFCGLGAYSSALLAVDKGAPFLVGVVCGVAVAAIVSLLVSVPSLRLHDDYFVIATFGFQVIVFSIFNSWIGVTRGPLGIPGIPPVSFFGAPLDSPGRFLPLAVVFALAGWFVIQRLASAPFGRALRSIREDEVFTRAVGKNTVALKIAAFAVSAAVAATAGSLYAHYISFIDPTSFTLMESILVISMVIIGGAASPWGPVVGAAVLVSLPEGLRFLGLPDAVAANVRQIFYGLLLVVMMMVRPQGLMGRYDFRS